MCCNTYLYMQLHLQISLSPPTNTCQSCQWGQPNATLCNGVATILNGFRIQSRGAYCHIGCTGLHYGGDEKRLQRTWLSTMSLLIHNPIAPNSVPCYLDWQPCLCCWNPPAASCSVWKGESVRQTKEEFSFNYLLIIILHRPDDNLEKIPVQNMLVQEEN